MPSKLIKLVVSLGLFVLIFHKVEFGDVRAVLGNTRWELLAPALVLQFLSALIASYRWYMIMHTLGFAGGPAFYTQSYLRGAFFNQALPTSIGGDALRVLEAARLGGGKREAFYGVFIDRIVGLVGLLLLNMVALLASSVLLRHNAAVHYIILLVAVAGIVGVAILALLGELEWLARNKFTKLLYDLSHRFRAVYRSPTAIASQLVLSVIIHLLAMMAVYTVGQGVGLDYSLTVFLVVVPPVILLTIVPISLAGWGVREGGMIGLFLILGADKAKVLSMSLMYGLLLIVASLPGLYFFLLGRQHKKVDSA
jgi:uncharacterized protein (TIRG00374 family)